MTGAGMFSRPVSANSAECCRSWQARRLPTSGGWTRWSIFSGLRVAVIALAVVLTYGGVVHFVQLAVGGWPPCRWAPRWLAIYYISLAVFDPLAAWLLMRRRVAGLYLASGVLVTDAAAKQ